MEKNNVWETIKYVKKKKNYNLGRKGKRNVENWMWER